MTMLDRIAEAIGEADVCGDLHEVGYMNLARAALTAMMEPERLPVRQATSFKFADIEWPKAIQAILNEGAEK